MNEPTWWLRLFFAMCSGADSRSAGRDGQFEIVGSRKFPTTRQAQSIQGKTYGGFKGAGIFQFRTRTFAPAALRRLESRTTGARRTPGPFHRANPCSVRVRGNLDLTAEVHWLGKPWTEQAEAGSAGRHPMAEAVSASRAPSSACSIPLPAMER